METKHLYNLKIKDLKMKFSFQKIKIKIITFKIFYEIFLEN